MLKSEAEALVKFGEIIDMKVCIEERPEVPGGFLVSYPQDGYTHEFYRAVRDLTNLSNQIGCA